MPAHPIDPFPCEPSSNKTGLQPVSRPVKLVHYFGGWVEGPSKQTDRTDGGWVQSTFGAKAEQFLAGKKRVFLMQMFKTKVQNELS